LRSLLPPSRRRWPLSALRLDWLPTEVLARLMPFGFSFGITSHRPQTGPAFTSSVEWPTPTDVSGQTVPSKLPQSFSTTCISVRGSPKRTKRSWTVLTTFR
jgi:hypothetical protein